jgi:hypothetical protein
MEIETPPVEAPPAVVPPEGTPPAVVPPEGTPPAVVPPEGTPWYHTDADDWREQIAGKDETKLNLLKRVTDPSQLFDNYFEGQKTLSQRVEAAAETLPENPTDEQLQAYREKNGVPNEATGYELKLSDGLVLSDEDRAEFQPVFEVMHGMNLPSDQVSAVTDSWLKAQNGIVAKEEARDSVDAADCTKALQDAWKGDFETNKGLINGMISSHLPEDSVDAFMNARLSDGTALFNNPGIVAALSNMARTINPAATLVPSGKDALTSLATRRAELEGQMGDDDWHKNAAGQKEYQEIVTAQEVFSSRQ